jgi:hypothetical protein
MPCLMSHMLEEASGTLQCFRLLRTGWALLLAVQGPAAAIARQDVSVFLDHVYIVVDSSTYGSLLESRYIREQFASFAERSTVSGDRTWLGLVVGGEHTSSRSSHPVLGLDLSGPVASVSVCLCQVGPRDRAWLSLSELAHGRRSSQGFARAV